MSLERLGSPTYSFRDYKVRQYMYCHPNNVVLRKGQRKILNWQHMMATSELSFIVKSCFETGEILSLKLYHGTKSLEVLESLQNLYSSRSLQVITTEQWLAFKWTTRRGNTQFQIMLESHKEISQLLQAIERSGVRVEYKGRVHETATSANKLLLSQQQSQHIATNQETQNTQVADLEEVDAVGGKSVLFAQDATQLRSASQRHEGSWVTASQNLTQVEGDTQLEETMADDTVYSQRFPQSRGGLATHQPVPSDCYASTTFSESVSVFDVSGTNTRAKKKTVDLKGLDVNALINKKRALHLSVDTYSYAHLRQDRTNQFKWSHVGLGSDLCLSLVPADHNGEPIVTLSRGFTILEAFVPHPGYLRAYFADGFMILQQIGIGRRDTSRYVQLQMRQENIAITCEWLSYWQVSTEDPSMPGEPRTEATTDAFYGRSTTSEMSYRSRESQFWLRRTQLPMHENQQDR